MTPTGARFTNQQLDDTLNLYNYNARYYDHWIGRFLSADKFVPNASNPSSYNRYSYTYNNPIRFVDPTGHFSEAQLEGWFGQTWEDNFSDWQAAILLQAELGDVITDFYQSFKLVLSGQKLALWDLNSKRDQSLIHTFADWSATNAGLYRPVTSNLNGGPSQFLNPRTFSLEGLKEGYNVPQNVNENGLSLIHVWVFGSLHAKQYNPSLVIDSEWYLGYDSHVQANSRMVNFDAGLHDIVETGLIAGAIIKGGKKAIKGAVGGAPGAIFLAVDVMSWIWVDTIYSVVPGAGTPPIQRVPTPSPLIPIGTPTP